VSHGSGRTPGADAPVAGDVLRIGEAPGCDYRVGPAIACPAPSDAPPWQALLFYEAAGALRVLPFQFVHVGVGSVEPERGVPPGSMRGEPGEAR
jgi:hypothetical protein